MYTGRLIFSQVVDFMPLPIFRRCVAKYHGDFNIKKFSCLDQFLCMAFAQLTYRESLRDIEVCLRSQNKKLYHMGIRGNVSRSILAEANENRDWRIYAELAQTLIATARKLYSTETFLEDLRGNIPTFIHISDGKLHDVNVLDILPLEAGAYYIMDRGYLDFKRLFSFNKTTTFFVTRAKSNTRFRRLYSHPVDKSTGLICDQTIVLTGVKSKKEYPDKLRRIKFKDPNTLKTLVFLTNNFTLPPLTIAKLYKSRWQVELFFKWIKQHLRIKKFFGTSANAVKSQIWIAVSVYVLVAILKKELRLQESLYTILQILSVTIFEKDSIYQLITDRDSTAEVSPVSK